MEKMTPEIELDQLRNQLSVEAKNGIDFTLAASLVWALITFIWSWDLPPYTKSVYVFIAGGPMLPLAYALSRILKTNWKVKDNPLQPLGLWLNFAQLFYFPFLVFILIHAPDYFLMTYSIITGAHFFPYAWFYKTKWYAVFAGVISLGSLLAGLYLEPNHFFYIGLFTSLCLAALTVGLIIDVREKKTRTSGLNNIT